MSNVLRGTIVNPEVIRGKSAYEIAVMHGFDGTEEEWVKATDLAKEITLDCSTKAQYYASLAETANENAGMHETDARESARDAQAHLQEVRNIVDAAGEKLDLLEQIPDDYITLDADVKSNTALIAGNKADIASNEGAIAKNAENITRNTKRITNIEQGLTPDSFETDDSVAYQKDVPANALPYAAVQKVGGMTRKCANLIPFPYVSMNTSFGGGSMVANADGGIALSGTPTAISYLHLYVGTPPKGVVTLSVSGTFKNARAFLTLKNQANEIIYDNAATPSLTCNIDDYPSATTMEIAVIREQNNVALSGVCYVMLNAGSTALPYEPYYEGLRSAKVTEVKSVGENMFDYHQGITQTNNCNIKIIEDGFSISVIGTAPFWRMTDYKFKLPKGEYYFYSEADLGAFIQLWDNISGAIVSGKGFFTLNNDAQELHLELEQYTLGQTHTARIAIYKVQKDEFIPYIKRTLPIPEAVRPANGINENVYDYIEWAEDGSVKKTVRCKKIVIDGSSDEVIYKSMDGAEFTLFQVNIDGAYNYSPAISNNLPHYVSWDTNSAHFYVHSEGIAFVLPNSIGTDIASVRAYLATNPLEVVYELAEPIVTDISDLITADNLIGVEGGGTLTFENEHKYAVPSEVEYQVEV